MGGNGGRGRLKIKQSNYSVGILDIVDLPTVLVDRSLVSDYRLHVLKSGQKFRLVIVLGEEPRPHYHCHKLDCFKMNTFTQQIRDLKLVANLYSTANFHKAKGNQFQQDILGN